MFRWKAKLHNKPFVFIIFLVIFFTIHLTDVPAAFSAATPTVFVNGSQIFFDVPPVIIEDRTLVPFRSICESLGVQVLWDENTQAVTAFKPGTTIKLQIGNNTATINGYQVLLDVPAQIVNNRTLVPLRFISESLGAVVDWNESTDAIYIDFRNKDILEFQVPPALGVPQLSKEKIEMLAEEKNPDNLKMQINTVYDLLQYMISAHYTVSEAGETTLREGNLVWHHNRPADSTIKFNAGNCGATSNMVNYLLHGDYDQVGFIHHTDNEGGHVYNYIMQNGKYYIIDFMQYMVSDYTHFSYRIYELNSLQEWPQYCAEVYCPNTKLKTVVGYTTMDNHLPVACVKNDRYIRYPKGCEIEILFDAPDDNYDIIFVDSPVRIPEWD